VSAAKQKAADYLSYGDMSRRTLEGKLTTAGYNRDAACEAAQYYVKRGVVDDLRYAVNRAEYMKDIKNYGPRRIRQALYEKGVPAEIIRQALEEEQFEDFSVNLDSLLAKKYKASQLSDKDKRLKAIQALYRHGYEQQDISAAITRLLTGK
jgi:regulatory protein